jgi:hypothetical protein
MRGDSRDRAIARYSSGASANHRRSTCASPAMRASQGDSLGVFSGFFWLVLVFFRPSAARAPPCDLFKIYMY